MPVKEFDIIPDNSNWKDQGCELHDSCLHCPREKCVEDEPRARQTQRLQNRALHMRLLKAEGKNIKDIARIFEVSLRTVQRALANAKPDVPADANSAGEKR